MRISDWSSDVCSSDLRRLPVHQHPADVGVDEQRVGLFLRVLRPGERAALTAVLRVLDGVLIGDIGLTKPLNTDTEARGVHHHEHRREAFILPPDPPPLGALILTPPCRIGMETPL